MYCIYFLHFFSLPFSIPIGLQRTGFRISVSLIGFFTFCDLSFVLYLRSISCHCHEGFPLCVIQTFYFNNLFLELSFIFILFGIYYGADLERPTTVQPKCNFFWTHLPYLLSGPKALVNSWKTPTCVFPEFIPFHGLVYPSLNPLFIVTIYSNF